MKSTILSAMFAAPITFVADREQDQAGHQDVRCAFLVTIVAVLAVLPIMIFGIPNGADFPNHLRFALPFYEALQSGHLHPGWLAESNTAWAIYVSCSVHQVSITCLAHHGC